MELNYFDLTIGLSRKQLLSLKQFLGKGAAYAESVKMSETNFLNQKLAEDMFPLVKQVQVATDNAKGMAARLSETPPLSLADTETTLAELYDRIDTVIAYLDTFTPAQFETASAVQITLPYFEGKYFTAHDYVLEFAIPNFMFHINMAYAIIRVVGVPLGKQDSIGSLTMHDVA